MNWVVLGVLISHWRRQKNQFLGLFLGIALATGLWSGVQAINAEARVSYGDAEKILVGQYIKQITSSKKMTVSDYAKLRRSGWQVTPVLLGTATIQNAEYDILGADFLTAALIVDMPNGAAPGARPVIFANPKTAGTLVDARFDVRTRADLPQNQLLMDISTAEFLTGQRGVISRFLVLDKQPMRQTDLRKIDPSFTLYKPDNPNDINGLTESFRLSLTAFGFLSFAVGLFIVQATIGLALEQRRGTIRTLRAIGVGRLQLTNLMLAELLLFAAFAGAVGLALGYLIAAALLPDVAATLSGLYGAEVSGSLQFRPVWALAGLAMTMAGTLIAGGQALWRIWQMPILRTAQHRAWAMAAHNDEKWRLITVAFLIILALAFLAFGSGLIAGFASLAGFMLAAALVLPSLLGAILRFASKLAKSAKAQWFWADSRQQLPHLSLALMALLLALATNIGVTSMVSSFRVTFIGWLDQRLASELYVSLENQEDGPRFQAWVTSQVDTVLPLLTVETRLFSNQTEVMGLVVHATYRDNWQFIDATNTAWDAVANRAGVLVNEQLARRQNLSVGSKIELTDTLSLPVVGIYSDYGNPFAQVTISQDLLKENYQNYTVHRFALRLDPARAPELRERIIGEFDLPPDAVFNQLQIKALARNVFERTFVVSSALNMLTLLVAALAILISLATLAKLRLSQLAPVWALGMSRGELAFLELARALALALFTFVFALPLGIFLTWFLLAVVNVEAFGWRLPLYHFPAAWGWLLVMTFLSASLAAAAPAYQLWRRKPAEFLKVFANES